MEHTMSVHKTYTRNSIADEICGFCIKNGMTIFGGYVRDRDIMGLKTFNDIDIVYFSDSVLDTVLKGLCLLGYGVITEIKETDNFTDYKDMSHIIESVFIIEIVSIYGAEIIEEMKFHIDFVKCKSFNLWKEIYDCDFSCNLFYKNSSGIGLRYSPVYTGYTGQIDDFTYWKNATINKKFYIVLNKILITGPKGIKLHSRASKLVNNGWKMYNTLGAPFNIGLFKNIKIKDRSECSVCLTDFTSDKIIVNTLCKHSFCNECFQKVLEHSGNECSKCPNCRKVICKASKRLVWPDDFTTFIEVD